MNETIDSSSENFTPASKTGDRSQMNAAKADWKDNLRDHLFIILSISITISLLVGYLICQKEEAKRRERQTEILFRQVKNWLAERGRQTAGSVEQGLEYARSAAEKGAEYGHRLNPFHKKVRRRFFGIF